MKDSRYFFVFVWIACVIVFLGSQQTFKSKGNELEKFISYIISLNFFFGVFFPIVFMLSMGTLISLLENINETLQLIVKEKKLIVKEKS